MSFLKVLRLFAVLGIALAQIDGGRIELGQTVEGSVEPGQEIVYVFEGQAGEIITVLLNAANGDWDPTLELYNPDGTLLAFDDDGGSDRNAAIHNQPLPAEGEYRILVRSYGNRSGGPFTLNLETGILPPTTGGGSIMIGEPVTAAFTEPGQEDVWTFEGKAGDVVSIAMESDLVDATLYLQGPNGEELIYDDDSGDNANALIYGYTLPEDGLYTLLARPFHEDQTGEYRLSLLAGEAQPEPPTPTPAPTPAAAGMLKPGQMVRGNLTAGRSDAWTFEGKAGDNISLLMHSMTFDAYLIVYGPAGELLAFNDDSGPDTSAMVHGLHLPEDTTYTVIAQPATGSAGGPYTLTLHNEPLTEEAVRLSAGEPQAGELEAGEVDLWAISVTQGQTATINIQTQGELSTTGIEVFNLETGPVAAGTDQLTAVLIEPGDYFAWVYGQPSGAYTIMLDLAPPPVIDGGEISVGERVDAFLSDSGTGDTWLLDIISPQGPLAVNMTATGAAPIDPYLTVSTPTGDRLGSDDDGGGGLNALVTGLMLTEPGTYHIIAQNYNPDQNGPYTLEVFEIPPAELGQRLEERLPDENAVDVWALSIAEPMALKLELESEAEIFVELRGPEGQNWFIEQGTNFLPLRKPQVYTLVVTTQSGGEYALKINRGELPEDRREALNYDTRVTGTLAPNQRDIWTFTAGAGDVISAGLESPTFDAYMEVWNTNGVVIAADDDSGRSTDALLTAYTLPTEGEYHLVVQSFEGDGTGPYLLSLYRGESLPAPPGTSGQLEVGQTISGTLETVGARDSWAFTAQTEGYYKLTVDDYPAALAEMVYVSLYDASDILLYSADLTTPDLTSLYLYAGQYRVEVRHFADDAGSAQYTLHINRVSVP